MDDPTQFDPGMDPPPDAWSSPEYDPGFPVVVPDPPVPEDTSDPEGPVAYADGYEMHRETIQAIAAQSAALARLIRTITGAGLEIVTLTPAQVASQRIRFRVQYLIISRATAGAAVLNVGTGSFTFTTAAAPVRVDFPLVIERGVDMLYTGDGFLFLVGWPE